MGKNTTDTGGISGADIASLVASGCSVLVAFASLAYVHWKANFRDKQETDIEVCTTKTGKGGKTTTIKIKLTNDESFAVEHKHVGGSGPSVGTVNVTLPKGMNLNDGSSPEPIEAMQSMFDSALKVNHQGDKITATKSLLAMMAGFRAYIASAGISVDEDQIHDLFPTPRHNLFNSDGTPRERDSKKKIVSLNPSDGKGKAVVSQVKVEVDDRPFQASELRKRSVQNKKEKKEANQEKAASNNDDGDTVIDMGSSKKPEHVATVLQPTLIDDAGGKGDEVIPMGDNGTSSDDFDD
jgi:hypothetical protein